jgi:hypothetical protein
MQRQKTQNDQHILREKKVRDNTTKLQDFLSSYSNQGSMVLVKEQTGRSIIKLALI